MPPYPSTTDHALRSMSDVVARMRASLQARVAKDTHVLRQSPTNPGSPSPGGPPGVFPGSSFNLGHGHSGQNEIPGSNNAPSDTSGSTPITLTTSSTPPLTLIPSPTSSTQPPTTPYPSVTSSSATGLDLPASDSSGAIARGKHSNAGAIAGGIIGAFLFIALAAVAFIAWRRRRRRHRTAPSAEFMRGGVASPFPRRSPYQPMSDDNASSFSQGSNIRPTVRVVSPAFSQGSHGQPTSQDIRSLYSQGSYSQSAARGLPMGLPPPDSFAKPIGQDIPVPYLPSIPRPNRKPVPES